MHHWSEDDDLIVYCLYRLDAKEHTLGIEPTELAQILGMPYGSLGKKISNFKFLDGLPGLERYSKQAERIYNRCRGMSNSELRLEGVKAVGRALDKYSNGR